MILFIVESPNKIQKIKTFLGSNYEVAASVGHFRDMDPKSMSINFDTFEPIYVITNPKVVSNLKKIMHKVRMVYLATDLDREGEAIAQHLYDVLKLRPDNSKRLTFNAITSTAIKQALAKPTQIDSNLVDAQKARRVLDRMFGYMISPLLCKNLGPRLSAGRVQSVAVRMIIDRSDEIKAFLSNLDHSFFLTSGSFMVKPIDGKKAQDNLIEVKLVNEDNSVARLKNPVQLLKKTLQSTFVIKSIDSKLHKSHPPPPFTTSSLQQTAYTRFKWDLKKVMQLAQKLYEGGFITYMRTDSVELSKEAHSDLQKLIKKKYGTQYYFQRHHKTKTANSQEAHEAIRPTHVDLIEIEKEVKDHQQVKLYQLIWARTVASQMSPAEIEEIMVKISGDKLKSNYYLGSCSNIVFDGYMKVYHDNPNEKNLKKNQLFSHLKVNSRVYMNEIISTESFEKPKSHYNEGSLVKCMEKLEIGRPSTYASIVKTIQDRNYVETSDVPGIQKEIAIYSIHYSDPKTIDHEVSTILVGKESHKLIPTDLGMRVNQYLLEHFAEFMDYQFTSQMEKDLDKIAKNKLKWDRVVGQFYHKLKPKIDQLTVATQEANQPNTIGSYQNKPILLCHGPYGHYIQYDGTNYKAQANIQLSEAIELINKEPNKKFEFKVGRKKYRATIYEGKFGPYVQIINGKTKKNYPLKDVDLTKVTEKDIIELIS